MRTLVAYVPVLHEGYLQFFKRHTGKQNLYILGEAFIEEIPVYRKDIRRLPSGVAKQAIESLCIFEKVEILTKENIATLNRKEVDLVLADEDAMRTIAEKYFTLAKCTFEKVFLMWDRRNALEERPILSSGRITTEEFHRKILGMANIVANQSSDIWRHVGAILVKDGNVVLSTHNKHVPQEHVVYENGDPRNAFNRGDHIEFSSAIHAEAGLISEAARQGIPTNGTDFYVTDFPCPPCAKLIANAGIKNLYCGGGYAVLDGEDVLESAGVKIIFID